MIATGVTVAVTPASGTQSTPSRSASQLASAPARFSGAASSCFLKQVTDWIGSAYLAGWANAAKLRGSALLSPGRLDKPMAAFQDLHGWYLLSDFCNNTLYQYATGALDYGKHHLPQFPPGRTTFLSFGFMPTTATMQLMQVPISCKDVAGQVVAPPTYECIVAASNQSTNSYIVTSTSEMQIKISDVRVNGVKLDVGNNCRSATFKTVLEASSGNQYDVLAGGILQGSPTIPQWTGCGARENLDPLIDAALSGKGNFTIVTQGPTCAFWINPPNGVNPNCRIPPGPGNKYGVPKYYPIPMR